MPWPSENRIVFPVSFALLENIKIYFEENLPNDSIDLLHHLLVSGKRTTAPKGSRRNSVLPPPSYLDLISTFPVHPRHTTHAKSRDDHQPAINAMGYLQLLPAMVSVKDSGMGQTFRFDEARSSEVQRWERGTKRKARVALEGSETVAFDDVINHPLARDGVWTQAKDFWHVVGWAINCGVWHWRRWEYWQLWLEFMLSVMERDVEERTALRDEGEEGDAGRLEESIMGRFLLLNGPEEGRQVWKRAAKAIFADGSERSMNEFPPVWRDETREPKEDEMEVYTAPSIYRDEEDPSACWLKYTGPSVRELRIRLMALLLHICIETPSTSSISPYDLSDLLASHIIRLPFPVYTALVRSEPCDTLHPASMSILTQTIITWLIDHAAPANPNPYDTPTQDTLATCFLPFAANTSSLEDNARLSWAVEILLRMYFDAHRDTCPTPALVKAVEAGISARKKRVEGAKVRGGAKGEEDEMFMQQMSESAWRMRMVVEVVEEAMERKKSRAESVEREVDRSDPVVRAKAMADFQAEWDALD
ncbi:hypothetical protein V496_08014 [Pseudogymnoascus sp. VKM F-4515 (FW-2607)]|nr:hypothetical protein V496_08014 [Pseudogymnoascus sp. VKM F-4515 (FW-2607)]KFY91868.1 hypothetical protein V498_05282 [Pseudogymnoascus sp. VKM F-4517 (FW-2822)]